MSSRFANGFAKPSQERYGPPSTERLREPREHREVGVKLHAGESANAKRRETGVVLQTPKLAPDGCAAPVQVAEALRVAEMRGKNRPPIPMGMAGWLSLAHHGAE
jgi:hypothetical protein